MQKNWYNLSVDETYSKLNTSAQGLNKEEAKKRLVKYGYNEIQEAKKISPWMIFLSQFKNVFIILLLAAVIISFIIGEFLDGTLILIILLFAALLGFIQEYKAEKAIEALKKMAAPSAWVIRDGNEIEIPAKELVPGDVILLRIGARISADARLVEQYNLRADESPLTGESVTVGKNTKTIKNEKPPLGDRKNMVYMGTSVAYGRGMGVVVTTGMSTEFGKIAGMLQEIEEEKTPSQKRLDKLGKTFLMIALIIVVVLAILGIARGKNPIDMFIWAVALAIAVVPEALPAVVVISLALGVRRMVKRNALIRKLPAVETLGSISVICSDKTGTLTQDKMTVRKVYTDGRTYEVTGVGFEPKGSFLKDGKIVEPDEHVKLLLQIGALCNDSKLVKEERWVIKGDATEGALVVAASKAGFEQDTLNKENPRIAENPFTSERKRMTTVNITPQGRMAYSKGALEVILESCNRIYKDNNIKPLTDEDKKQILETAHGFAEDALRILGLAYKPVSDEVEKIETDLIFVGFAGMIDPPREEVKEAIKRCETAGIKAVMITGDHKLTALAVAKELGMLKKGIALEGKELEDLSDEAFEKIVEDVEVYARVSPEHKLRIVKALKKKGHIIAMTGDGINDAPALKDADVGIAMGITGTDVTKESADMILTDDNFASIVDAIEEGRGIYGNIKKYLMYLLSANAAEVLILAIAILAGFPLPLIAIQILYINLATDGLPAIALSVDPAEPDIMSQQPRDPKEGIFTRPVVALMIIGAIWSTIVCLSVFLLALNQGMSEENARCMLFVTLILIEFGKAFNYRSDIHSIAKIGVLRNKWLVAAVIWECALLMLIVYLAVLHVPFSTFSMGWEQWVVVIFAALTIFPVLEAAKFGLRSGWFGKLPDNPKQS